MGADTEQETCSCSTYTTVVVGSRKDTLPSCRKLVTIRPQTRADAAQKTGQDRQRPSEGPESSAGEVITARGHRCGAALDEKGEET